MSHPIPRRFSLLASQSDDYLAYLFEDLTCKLSLVAKHTTLLQLQNTTLQIPSRNATTDEANKHIEQAAWKRNLTLIIRFAYVLTNALNANAKRGSVHNALDLQKSERRFLLL